MVSSSTDKPRSWRSTLDLIAAVTMTIASLVLVALMVSTYSGRRRSDPSAVPPPAEPVDLVGAYARGNPSAKVALIEYAEFQCPACGTFARDILPTIERDYVNTGRVLLAFRHVPDVMIHPLALKSAEAALCAGKQGRFWEMREALFGNQRDLGLSGLAQRASDLGLDRTTFDSCVAAGAAEQIRSDIGGAALVGVSATPTLLIGRMRTDGRVQVTRRVVGAAPVSVLQEILDDLLRSTAGS